MTLAGRGHERMVFLLHKGSCPCSFEPIMRQQQQSCPTNLCPKLPLPGSLRNSPCGKGAACMKKHPASWMPVHSLPNGPNTRQGEYPDGSK